MNMQFGDADWYDMVAGTILALHAENGYPPTLHTSGHMFYMARDVPGTDVNALRAWLLTQPRPTPVPQPVPVPVPTPTPVPPPAGGPMPNRKDEVKMICDLHPEAFPEGDDDALNAARLKLLRTVIIPTLNALDGGQWGLLMKKDQNDKIPVDILVWRPTAATEYIDVMSGTGATWQHRDNPNPSKWVWVAA
jgi:hypothetical protein